MGCSSSAAGGASNPKGKGKKITLGYYGDIRGMTRGMVTRYVLNYCGVAYEWRPFKVGTNEFKDWKANHELAFINLPHLIDGDVTLTEAIAVQQYIAMKGRPEMLGTTPQDKANRYRIQVVMYERFMNWFPLVFRPGNTREAIAQKSIEVN